jgi:hypothetical protein
MIRLPPQELHHGLEFCRSIQIAVSLLPGHENTTRHDGPQRGAHHQVRVRYVSESVDLRGPAIGSPNEHSHGECHSRPSVGRDCDTPWSTILTFTPRVLRLRSLKLSARHAMLLA